MFKRWLCFSILYLGAFSYSSVIFSLLKSNRKKKKNYICQHFVSCGVICTIALCWPPLKLGPHVQQFCLEVKKTVFLSKCSVLPYSRIIFVLCSTLPVVLWHTHNGENISDIFPTATRFAIGTSPFFWSDQVRTLLGCVCWWFLEIVCHRYIHRLYVQITLNCWDVPKDLLFQEVEATVSHGVPSRT